MEIFSWKRRSSQELQNTGKNVRKKIEGRINFRKNILEYVEMFAEEKQEISPGK